MSETLRDWLVWSYEHDAWWAPNRAGYRRHAAEAGRYTREEAATICDNANRFCPPAEAPHEIAIHESHAVPPEPGKPYEIPTPAVPERDGEETGIAEYWAKLVACVRRMPSVDDGNEILGAVHVLRHLEFVRGRHFEMSEGEDARRWRKFAMQCATFLHRDQIAVAAKAAGLRVSFCLDGDVDTLSAASTPTRSERE